ncbi:MAG: retropepsin-like aspartic protease [Candidatus Velthaea sp.]
MLAAAGAQALPDSATLRDRMRAAAGPLPAAYHEKVAFTSTAGDGTIETFRRGADYREVTVTGPFRTERGALKGEAWHQNANGIVISDAPDAGIARTDSFTTTVSRGAPPENYYVISTLNAANFGSRQSIDPATYRLVRAETIGANGTTTTVYDAFKSFGSRTLPAHWTVRNEANRTVTEATLVEYSTDGVLPKNLEIPPLREVVEFPAGLASVDLPVKMYNNRVYVRVDIAGRGLDFLLDTGASGITIDESVAQELGLAALTSQSSVTAQRFTLGRTIVPEMHVGPLAMRNIAVARIPQPPERFADVRVAGLLGFDFLAELGVTIDYEHRSVTVVPANRYHPPAGAPQFPLDVRMNTGQPMVTVRLNGVPAERMLLDTGASGTFLLFEYFARLHPEVLRDRAGAAGVAGPRTFTGVGGTFTAEPYRIDELTLGGINFQQFVGYRVTSKGAYAVAQDGLIGTDFLHLFTVGLDYAHGHVDLVPNGEGRRAMRLSK